MIKFKVRKSDFARLEATFEEAVRQVHRRAMKRALLKAAQPALKMARDLAPQRWGFLEESLIKKGRTYKDGRAYVIVGPNRNVMDKWEGKWVRPVMYAHLVEFGTVHSAPEPFLRPAFEAKKEEMKKIYAREIGKALEAETAQARRRMAKKR